MSIIPPVRTPPHTVAGKLSDLLQSGGSFKRHVAIGSAVMLVAHIRVLTGTYPDEGERLPFAMFCPVGDSNTTNTMKWQHLNRFMPWREMQWGAGYMGGHIFHTTTGTFWPGWLRFWHYEMDDIVAEQKKGGGHH